MDNGVYISPNTGNTYMRVSYFNHKELFTTSLYMTVDGDYLKLMVKQAPVQRRPVQSNTPCRPSVTQGAHHKELLIMIFHK